MVEIDNYATAGFALQLLAQSRYHKSYKLGDYFRVEILPALWADQIQFYLTDAGQPTAMVTWAWISKDIEAELHETGRSLRLDEWQSGDRLFFNDWVSPYGSPRPYFRDCVDNVFPGVNYASSIRRNPDGSVRRVNHWRRAAPRPAARGAAS